MKQDFNQINLINDPDKATVDQVHVVAESFTERVTQNRIMPITYVLKELFKNSEKRLKFFSQACKDPKYAGIFDIQLDNSKIKFFSNFFKSHTNVNIDAETMFEGMFDTEESQEGFGGKFVPVASN